VTVKKQPETFRPHPQEQELLEAIARAHYRVVDKALRGSLEDNYLDPDFQEWPNE